MKLRQFFYKDCYNWKPIKNKSKQPEAGFNKSVVE